MGRKRTGKVMEDKVWVPQKNGTWYCYERRRVWEDGRTKTLSRTLLGKADERGGELRPTRPKRRAGEGPQAAKGEATAAKGEATAAPSVEATRQHTGLTDILEHVGKVSGVDKDVRAVLDGPTADKVISLARYSVASDGGTWPGIEPWMLTHPVPYEHPITEDVYLDLFRELGPDEAAVEGFFARRIAREEDPVLLAAYDSSTETSETRNPEARLGTSKDRPGKPAARILALCSLTSRRPLAYAKRPGNVPDVVSVDNALAQPRALTDRRIALVTDAGFASELALGSILHLGHQSLTRARLSWGWVREAADANLERLLSPSALLRGEPGTHGITVTVTRDFPFRRAYGSKKKGLKAGDVDHVRRRVHVHVYYDPMRRERENQEFMAELFEVMGLVEEGKPLDARAEDLRDRFLEARKGRKGRVRVSPRRDAIDEACKCNGMFALVATHVKDAGEALAIYRHREWVEDYFERFRQDCDGKVTRTGDPENPGGRLFVQFVAMCYLEELHNMVRDMKARLGEENGDPKHDTKEVLDAERGLRSWLGKRSLHNTLRWFDAHETFEVSSDIRRKKWSTETTKRDRLFLRELGMSVPE